MTGHRVVVRQSDLPRVFRLNPKAPETPVWSNLWVVDGYVRLCETSDPVALRWAVMTDLKERYG